MSGLKKGDFVSAGKYKAWVFALYEEYSLAAILSDSNVNFSGEVTISKEADLWIDNSELLKVKTSCLEVASGISFKSFLAKRPPLYHLPFTKQLFTGYHQLDVCQPISLGQSVLFYGKANKGKKKLGYQAAEAFSKLEGHKVVIASPNPIKSKTLLENVIFYSSPTDSSEISQYFLSFAALAHACYLRDQGFNVLFILDDILFHTFKEKSIFPTEKILNTNIGSLIFEHSKRLTENSSLTSIAILNEDISDENHRLLTQGLKSHLRSLFSQSVSFHSDHPIIEQSSPALDFVKPVFTDYPYQLPILKLLRKKLMKVFSELKEVQDIENIKEKFGFKSDPWEKYLLLDSKYFISALSQDSQMSTTDLIVFIEFVAYSVQNELISLFKLEMAEVRKEFLKFVKTCSAVGLTELARDPAKVDPEAVLKDIDVNVIKHFYVEAKMQGWLKEYKDDYEELFNPNSVTQFSTLKTESNIEPSKAKTILERIFKGS